LKIVTDGVACNVRDRGRIRVNIANHATTLYAIAHAVRPKPPQKIHGLIINIPLDRSGVAENHNLRSVKRINAAQLDFATQSAAIQSLLTIKFNASSQIRMKPFSRFARAP
jgi:hypothetical protein